MEDRPPSAFPDYLVQSSLAKHVQPFPFKKADPVRLWGLIVARRVIEGKVSYLLTTLDPSFPHVIFQPHNKQQLYSFLPLVFSIPHVGDQKFKRFESLSSCL